MTPAARDIAATIPSMYTREAKKRAAAELLKILISELKGKK